MRLRVLLLSLCLFTAFAMTGCNKPASDVPATPLPTIRKHPADEKASSKEALSTKSTREGSEEAAAGRSIRNSDYHRLGSAIGSKLSKPGDTFTGSVAKDVVVGNAVAIPQGANVSGTVADAKPLGKFKGGAALQVRLDSVQIKGADVPVQAAARSFAEKGKGKRTAVLTGGGAALGGIIGALAGGGKGAAIGAAAGAGAGAGGSAFTGNKEIVLPAESDLD
jgi:hypothetical protein